MKNETLQKELVQILQSEQKWVKVHAAEFLIWEGLKRDLVYDTYILEENKYGNEPPYRIGIWRVLYQSAPTEIDKSSYIQKMVNAYDEGVDTLHIIETLAKLKVPFSTYNENFKNSILASEKIDAYSIYGLWNLYADPTVDKANLFNRLHTILVDEAVEDQIKMVISYVLRYIPIEEDQWKRLAQTLQHSMPPAVEKQLLASLLLRSAAIDPDYEQWRTKLVASCTAYADHALLMTALSRHQDTINLSHLSKAYAVLSDATHENYNPDLHATAAYSLLRYQSL